MFDRIGMGEFPPAPRSESLIRGMDYDVIGFLFFMERML